MAIGYVGSAVGTSSATLPTHQANDVILAFAFVDGSATAPTLPSGWTNIANAGANTCAYRLAWRRATAPGTTSGTWTNATSVVFIVYRGALQTATPTGNGTVGSGSSTTVAYNAVSFSVTTGTSWAVGFSGTRTSGSTAVLENPPTGMVARADATDTTDEAVGNDTNGGVTGWSTQSVAIGGTATGWFSYVVELLAAPPVTLTAQHSSSAVLDRTVSVSGSTSAILRRTYSVEATSDSVLLSAAAAQTVEATSDSVLLSTQTVAGTTSAAAFARALGSHSTSAAVLARASRSHSTSSSLAGVGSYSLTQSADSHISRSASLLASTSSWIIPAGKDFSRQASASLPADAARLGTIYTSADYSAVATADSSSVLQSGSSYYRSGYMLHQYRVQGVSPGPFIPSWTGKAHVAASVKPVYLEVFNNTSLAWDVVAVDSTSVGDTTFTLSTYVSPFSDYFDAQNWVTVRVRQAA